MGIFRKDGCEDIKRGGRGDETSVVEIFREVCLSLSLSLEREREGEEKRGDTP